MRYRTIAIIQARMKSSRLPDKVMLDIAGKPMLQRVIERTARAKLVDQVVVATTSGADEDPIAQLCEGLGVPCFRGSLQDVLDRYYRCASLYSPDIVVRITADCPVIDPGLIDETIGVMTGTSEGNGFWKPQGDPGYYSPPTNPLIPWDYAATRLPPPWKRTYPIGLDVEAFTFNALEMPGGMPELNMNANMSFLTFMKWKTDSAVSWDRMNPIMGTIDGRWIHRLIWT